MEYLAGRTIGLEGLFARQNFYRQYGFVFHYSTIRHEYINNATPDVTDARLADAAVLPFNQLLEYDMRHFGFERPFFLRKWIHAPWRYFFGAAQRKQSKGVRKHPALPERIPGGPTFRRA